MALGLAAVLVAGAVACSDAAGPGAAAPGTTSTTAAVTSVVGTVVGPPGTNPTGTTGQVRRVSIPGTTSKFTARESYVYLPPSWTTDPGTPLPVLLLLGGIPGAADDWVVGGHLAETADAFAAQHDGRAPVLVATDFSGDGLNDTQCTDARKGAAETYLTRDVLPFVQREFRTATSAASTGVVGLSSGGFCSLMLPLRHPDLFAVFASYSAESQPMLDPPANTLRDLFGGDQRAFDAYDPTKLLAARSYPGLAGWFETGGSDAETLAPTRAVVAQAQRAGIATCLLIRPGNHDYGFWSVALRNSLPWLSAHLGLTPMPADRAGATCTDPGPASGASGPTGTAKTTSTTAASRSTSTRPASSTTSKGSAHG